MEEVLDFAQSYMASAIKLAHTYKQPFPYKTITDFHKSNILCAHFLMAHGIELYLKFLILLMGKKPKTDAASHKFSNLMTEIKPLLYQYYKEDLFTKKQLSFINYLDKSMKFRYPTDGQWTVIPDIFTEADTWNKEKIKKFKNNCHEIQKRLNDLGYKLNEITKHI